MNSGLDETTLNDIAEQSHVSVDVVQRHYQTVLSDLHHQARIHDFIPLLAMKRVRQHFRHVHRVDVQRPPVVRQSSPRSARQMDYAQV